MSALIIIEGLEMADNKSLSAAKNAKKDEFYTQLSDIEKEMKYYRQHFEGKTILCNCDDPFESNFFKYFVLNFNRLGLKKLIATSYTGSPIMGEQLLFGIDENGDMVLSLDDDPAPKIEKKPYKAIVTAVRDATGNDAVEMLDVAELFKTGENELTELEGNGDFRSQECIELLKESDIVITNPPFSLFREYLAQLIEYDKKFAIIGNQNVITYKEVFPLLKGNKLWLGYQSGHTLFEVPDTYSVPESYDLNDRQKLRSNGYIFDDNGKLWRNLGNICWFTNLDIKKRHEELILTQRYTPDKYPYYDNCDAIEVSKVADIPYDYSGVMGVPITFLEKYNPEQFTILGLSRDMDLPGKTGMKAQFIKDYFEQGGTAQISEGHPDLCYYTRTGKCVVPYRRVMIRNKHPEQPKEV